MSDHYEDINDAVAREVMGWDAREVHVPGEWDEPATVVVYAWLTSDNVIEALQSKWNPAESWADAGRVIDRITEIYGAPSIVLCDGTNTTDKAWCCEVGPNANELCTERFAATPQMAICLAALAAVRAA